MRIVYVVWLDAHMSRDVHTRQEVMELPPFICRSAGFYVGEDANVLRLATDYWDDIDPEGGTHERWRDVSSIPQALIQHRIEWDTDQPPDASTPHLEPPQ